MSPFHVRRLTSPVSLRAAGVPLREVYNSRLICAVMDSYFFLAKMQNNVSKAQVRARSSANNMRGGPHVSRPCRSLSTREQTRTHPLNSGSLPAPPSARPCFMLHYTPFLGSSFFLPRVPLPRNIHQDPYIISSLHITAQPSYFPKYCLAIFSLHFDRVADHPLLTVVNLLILNLNRNLYLNLFLYVLQPD